MSAPETEAGGCFIDTNIWLYAFTVGDDPEKTTRAKTLIETQSPVFVSTQVINETCVNLIRKVHFSEQQVQQLIESFYAKYVVIEFNKPLVLKASTLREQHALSFWDSFIVASALERIVNAFTKSWIPAFAGMTLLLIYWSVMPAQAGIQNLLSV